MVKGYRVQLIKKDNRYSNIEKFVFEREQSYYSCRDCYLDASSVLLDGISHNNDTEWTKVGGVILGDFASERSRLPKIKEFVHTSEYYTYIVTMVCKE